MLKKHLIRLAKLADFLETKITNKQFNMERYRSVVDESYLDKLKACEFVSKNDCGTIGCALGWAPMVTPAQKSDFHKSMGTYQLNFSTFSRRALGLQDHQQEWKYLFDGDWADNKKHKTRLAAVKRIRKLVANGGVLDHNMKRTLRLIR